MHHFCGIEIWWTTAATTSELSSSDRMTSSRDQIRLTNYLFCPKKASLLTFTVVWFIFLHCISFWCLFHIFCIHISRVDFPAGTCAKVYSSMKTCSFSRILRSSILKNRAEWHPNSEIVSIKCFGVFFFSWDTIYRNLSQIAHQTQIFQGQRGKSLWYRVTKTLNNKEMCNWTQLAIITGERQGSETAQELKPSI